MVPRPPKRVKLPAVVMPHGKTQAPGTVLLRAVALVLEELFRQLQPSLLRQVPKIMERNRFTEIALLHQVLEKYVAPLPLLPEGDGSPSQIDLLQVILEKLPKGLGVPSGLLRGRKPVHIEVAEEAVKDFLQRLYALINSAQNQEASASAPEAPESASSSRKAPVQVDSQDSEDREAGAERRLSDRILHGDTLLSREQVERRICMEAPLCHVGEDGASSCLGARRSTRRTGRISRTRGKRISRTAKQLGAAEAADRNV